MRSIKEIRVPQVPETDVKIKKVMKIQQFICLFILLLQFNSIALCQCIEYESNDTYYYNFKDLNNVLPFFEKKYTVFPIVEEPNLSKLSINELQDNSLLDTFSFSFKETKTNLVVVLSLIHI